MHVGASGRAMCVLAVAAILAAESVAAQPATAGATPSGAVTALTGATLINPGAAPIRDAVVVVRGDRLACAGARGSCQVPAGARVADVRGAFIIPGLIDAHVH